jgi:chorismate mutase
METIKLDYPVTAGSTQISELNIRRPKVRDQIAAAKAKGGDAEREVAMFANLCEVEPTVIEAMDMADYFKLQEAYKNFLS